MVLLVILEMFRQHPDSLSEKSDLNLRRTGILIVQLILADYFLFLLVRKCHRLITSFYRVCDTMAAAWAFVQGMAQAASKYTTK
jgi:hypothetical protein